MRKRLSRRLLVATLIGLGLLVATGGTASAHHVARSPLPTITSDCQADANGDVTLVMTFQASPYGYDEYRLRFTSLTDGNFQRTGFGPGPNTALTVMITVPQDFQLVGSTVDVNGLLDDPEDHDEAHPANVIPWCEEPQPAPLDLAFDCATRTLTVSSPAVTFGLVLLFDENDVIVGTPTTAVPGSIVVGQNVDRVRFVAFGWASGYLPPDPADLALGVSCECTWTSVKDFSNIIVQYADGTEVKYDDLDGDTFTIPNDPDNPIVAVWIKAGREKLAPGDPAPDHFHGNGIGVYHSVENCELGD